MPEADWIMVRLKRETHKALCDVRSTMEVAEEMQLRELVRDPRGRVSLDQVIMELVYFKLRHAERRAKSAAKRKQGRTAEGPPSDTAGPCIHGPAEGEGDGCAEERKVGP